MEVNNCHIRLFIPYLDDGGKLYITILHSDTLTGDGTMILYPTQSHTIQAQSLCCAILSIPYIQKFN